VSSTRRGGSFTLKQTTLHAVLVVLGVCVACVTFESTRQHKTANFVWWSKSSVHVVACRIRWVMPIMLLEH